MVYFRRAGKDKVRWLSSSDLCCPSHMTDGGNLVRIRQKNDLTKILGVSLSNLHLKLDEKCLSVTKYYALIAHKMSYDICISFILYVIWWEQARFVSIPLCDDSTCKVKRASPPCVLFSLQGEQAGFWEEHIGQSQKWRSKVGRCSLNKEAITERRWVNQR